MRRGVWRGIGGPAPVRPTGAACTRLCWGDVLRTGLACALAAGIAWLLIGWIDASPRTVELTSSYSWALLLTGIDR